MTHESTSATALVSGDRFTLGPSSDIVYTLGARKTVEEAHGCPGWWLVGEDGGFADFVLDDYIANRDFRLIRRDAAYQALSDAIDNTPAIVHGAPPDDSGFTPCCGRSPLELPGLDRMTIDWRLVTCRPTEPTS